MTNRQDEQRLVAWNDCLAHQYAWSQLEYHIPIQTSDIDTIQLMKNSTFDFKPSCRQKSRRTACYCWWMQPINNDMREKEKQSNNHKERIHDWQDPNAHCTFVTFDQSVNPTDATVRGKKQKNQHTLPVQSSCCFVHTEHRYGGQDEEHSSMESEQAHTQQTTSVIYATK